MVNEIVVPLPNRRATRRLGERLAALVRAGDVLFLEGELGSGKTFLARRICRALGVPRSEPITSPTFALVHELAGRVPIVHADLYRLEHAAELDELGLEELLPRAVGLVEWGERFANNLAADGLIVRLALHPARRATLVPRGPRAEAITRALAAA